MAALEIPYQELGHTLARLTRMGLIAGKDVAIGASTLRISEEVIDNAIAQILQSESSQPVTPEASRENLYITPGSQARANCIALQRQYANQAISKQEYRTQRSEIRQQVLGTFLPMHVNPAKHNLIYGLSLDGCKRAIADGSPRKCDRLIHATHPVSSEDLWLREQGIEAATIIHAIVVGFDESAVQQWNDLSPSIPLPADRWRNLLQARLN